ncbi:NAD+ synthase [Methanolobus halotolerans]|uniref:NH(3)-dependent NAD(+) synthetase n=1 Tax=Methanolobus halotolerans TaxID=2052935 RepID=A0A4E0PUY4_9EURY|nr:NAD+ synthase [Methanolobus halotolerans]TGC07395.1 NAD(+) synthetase [Methanolobus halotolerans]
MDINKAKDIVVNFIRDRAEEAGVKGAVVGISGGIDSALTAYLTVEALGKENVLGIHMPELKLTPAEDVLDATEVAERLGIEFKTIDISGPLTSFIEAIPDSRLSFNHANGNLKARIRMSILYYYANIIERMVMGTGNKTEILLGYFTKYGDGGVDLEPIGDLYKSEVREMAYLVGVPVEIINKPPSAGLWEGQTDEEELGISYELVDRFLMLLLEGESPQMAQNTLGLTAGQRDSVVARIHANLHKQKAPPAADLDSLRGPYITA